MIAKNKKCSRNFGFDVHPVKCRHLWDGPSRHGPGVSLATGSGPTAAGHTRQSCPWRAAGQWGQVQHVQCKGRTKGDSLSLFLETRQPGPQGRMTSQWPVGTFASNQMSTMDTMMTPSSPEGRSSGWSLMARGPRPATFGLALPWRKRFWSCPHEGQ